MKVCLVDGSTDLVLSSDDSHEIVASGDTEARSVCSLVRTDEGGSLRLCFMGGGTLLRSGAFSVKAETPSDVVLQKKGNRWMYASSSDISVVLDGRAYKLAASKEFRAVD